MSAAAVPINRFCSCGTGRRRPPIRLDRSFAQWATESLPPGRLVATYYCRHCRTLVPIHPRYFDLAAPSTDAALLETMT